MKTESTYKAYRKTDITRYQILYGLKTIITKDEPSAEVKIKLNPYNKPDKCLLKGPLFGCKDICNYFEGCLINKMLKNDKIEKISDINLWVHNRLNIALAKL